MNTFGKHLVHHNSIETCVHAYRAVYIVLKSFQEVLTVACMAIVYI